MSCRCLFSPHSVSRSASFAPPLLKWVPSIPAAPELYPSIHPLSGSPFECVSRPGSHQVRESLSVCPSGQYPQLSAVPRCRWVGWFFHSCQCRREISAFAADSPLDTMRLLPVLLISQCRWCSANSVNVLSSVITEDEGARWENVSVVLQHNATSYVTRMMVKGTKLRAVVGGCKIIPYI